MEIFGSAYGVLQNHGRDHSFTQYEDRQVNRNGPSILSLGMSLRRVSFRPPLSHQQSNRLSSHSSGSHPEIRLSESDSPDVEVAFHQYTNGSAVDIPMQAYDEVHHGAAYRNFEKNVADPQHNEGSLTRENSPDHHQRAQRNPDAWTVFSKTDRRKLGTLDVAALILNKMVGTGIFTTPGTILSLTKSKQLSIGLWAVGGLYTLLRYFSYET